MSGLDLFRHVREGPHVDRQFAAGARSGQRRARQRPEESRRRRLARGKTDVGLGFGHEPDEQRVCARAGLPPIVSERPPLRNFRQGDLRADPLRPEDQIVVDDHVLDQFCAGEVQPVFCAEKVLLPTRIDLE